MLDARLREIENLKHDLSCSMANHVADINAIEPTDQLIPGSYNRFGTAPSLCEAEVSAMYVNGERMELPREPSEKPVRALCVGGRAADDGSIILLQLPEGAGFRVGEQYGVTGLSLNRGGEHG